MSWSRPSLDGEWFYFGRASCLEIYSSAILLMNDYEDVEAEQQEHSNGAAFVAATTMLISTPQYDLIYPLNPGLARHVFISLLMLLPLCYDSHPPEFIRYSRVFVLWLDSSDLHLRW